MTTLLPCPSVDQLADHAEGTELQIIDLVTRMHADAAPEELERLTVEIGRLYDELARTAESACEQIEAMEVVAATAANCRATTGGERPDSGAVVAL